MFTCSIHILCKPRHLLSVLFIGLSDGLSELCSDVGPSAGPVRRTVSTSKHHLRVLQGHWQNKQLSQKTPSTWRAIERGQLQRLPRAVWMRHHGKVVSARARASNQWSVLGRWRCDRRDRPVGAFLLTSCAAQWIIELNNYATVVLLRQQALHCWS